jgi:Lon protease-like protein
MKLPVFPIRNVVFFPSTTLPLNIFEPRYLTMVKDSIDNATPVVLCSGEPQPGDVAGYGDLKLLHRREDGTLLVAVVGRGKVRLGPLDSSLPYLQSECEPIATQSQLDAASLTLYAQLKSEFGSWIRTQVEDPEQMKWIESMLSDPQSVLDHLMSYRVQDPERKQELLNLNNINEQLAVLATLSEISSPSQIH